MEQGERLPSEVSRGALAGTAELRFSVLGPVRAWRDGAALPSGSPQQRALLAALLLGEGRVATAGELIDAIWGEEPPSQSLAGVRTYASRLRKVLGAGALVSESGGYALKIDPQNVDLFTARRLAAEADAAQAARDRDRARDLLVQSLGMWDGEALANVPGPYAETQRARLDEWRLQLLERRLSLDLETGRHAEAVSELTALTAAHPLRERLRELLMLALYRSGRQAEALAVYADTRRLLAEELGVDPRAELSQLQQRILRADQLLVTADGTYGAGEAEQGPAVRPAQLPATVPDFTGRTSLVRETAERLTGAEGAVVAVSALAGIGGVGKTTLAVHVAHQARPRFPDGQLYVDLQGAGVRAAEPGPVLGAFLRALGVADVSIPDSPDERAALYRSTVAGRRILVLLDNARDAAQIRPLLPGSPGCAALVTSRVRMVDLAGAHSVDLDVMSPDEALQLFTRIVGPERVEAERQAALDVVASCGFLPLAIRVAASRLAARRTWTVSVLAAKLADERHRLDELRAGDLDVRATFELGYGQLAPEQARAFCLLASADGPDISLDAAAALLALPPREAEELLESLVDTSLLESVAPGRYRYHDLVRLYARSCAERDQEPGESEEALSRLLDFHLATAVHAYAIVRPGDRLPHHLEPAGDTGLSFEESGEALDWLFAEAHGLLACVRQSLTGVRLRRAVDLLWAIEDLNESGANSQQYESAVLAALSAARRADDARAQARAHTLLAGVHLVAGRYAEADEQAEQAALFAHRAEDRAAGFRADNDRGVIATHQDRHADAERHLRRAVDRAREDGDEPGEASALCDLSKLRRLTGDSDDAIDLARQGLDILDRHGVSTRIAYVRYALGTALLGAGRPEEGLDQLVNALEGFGASRQRLWEGNTCFRIAQAHLAAHRPARAAQHAEQALAAGFIGGDQVRPQVLTTLGRALAALGQADRARACWTEALTLHERADSAQAEEVRGLLAPLSAA